MTRGAGISRTPARVSAIQQTRRPFQFAILDLRFAIVVRRVKVRLVLAWELKSAWKFYAAAA